MIEGEPVHRMRRRGRSSGPAGRAPLGMVSQPMSTAEDVARHCGLTSRPSAPPGACQTLMVRFSRRRALGLLPVLAASLAGGPALAVGPPLVEVWPLGAAPEDSDLSTVVAAIQAFFAVRVNVREPVPLPETAFYPPRARYRAERLLDHLVARASPGARVALGLASADISTTKGKYADWGVLGLATLDGRSAVLSSYRCRRGARSAAHTRERFAKTAVHELGHAFGLAHCPSRECLMHDGEGSVRTTDEESDFCAETRARLTAAGVLVEGARSPFV